MAVDLSRGIRDEIKHECGHLVVAKVLGFQTGEIAIHEGHSSAELFIPELPGEVDAKRDFIQRRIKVLFAGVLAQSMRSMKPEKQMAEMLLRRSGKNDKEKIDKLLEIYVETLVSPRDHELVRKGKREQIEARLFEEAEAIVGDHRPVIFELARAIDAAYRLAGGARDFKFSREKIDEHQAIRNLGQLGGHSERTPKGTDPSAA